MKLSTVVLFVLLAACGKANDLPAMKAEAEGIVKSYQARFDDLNRRADAIMQRGNAIGVTSADAANASRQFAAAKGKLEALRAAASNAPSEISGQKDQLALRKFLDKKASEFQDGYVEINGELDAIESWIALAEARPASQRVVPPPPSQSPPTGHEGHGH